MTVLQAAARPPRAGAEPPGSPPATIRARRSPRYVLLGVLLVLVGAVAFWVTSVRVNPRTAVLALARPVPVGHVLSDSDLQVVRIVPDPVLQAVPQTQRASVLGRTVQQPLAVNTLLSQSMLGPAAWPPSGQALIAVSVKAGHAPAGLGAGAQVLVLVVPSATAVGASNSSTSAGGSGSQVQQARAAVVAVGTSDAAGASVVSLLVSSSDAVRIVSAGGDVSLVVQGRAG